ncbi:MAG: hypothetical protein ACOCX8_03615, partial [Bacteroidota bacterium]
MSEANDSFEKDLDQLIRLFKKIKNKTEKEQFSEFDPALAQNLDFIISNYEMMKGNIPKEMLNQMGIPFQQLMRQFIDQMKMELGEEFHDLEQEEPTETTQEKQENLKSLTNATNARTGLMLR